MQKIEKPKKIIINAELTVPLGELATYTFPKKEGLLDIVELLDKKPYIVNCIIEKIVRGIIKKKKLDVKIKKLEYNYSDSNNIDFGVAYFKANLKGTEKNLKRIAGENRIFFFDWEENIIIKSIETLSIEKPKNI